MAYFFNFGRSGKWSTVRKNHLKNYPSCAACGRKDNLEVHHIIPYQIDRSKELDPNNLITLCGKYCHFVFGHLMDWKSWNTNIIEDAKNYKTLIVNRPFLEPIIQYKPRRYGYEIIIIMANFVKRIFRWNN
jgi:hypothetical protein